MQIKKFFKSKIQNLIIETNKRKGRMKSNHPNNEMKKDSKLSWKIKWKYKVPNVVSEKKNGSGMMTVKYAPETLRL